MKILFFIDHPAYFYFYKNIMVELKIRGHELKVVARDKDITLSLLKHYNIDYELLPKPKKTLVGKAFEMLYIDYLLYRISKKFNPEILSAAVGITVSHVAKVLNKTSIVFDDTEHATSQLALMRPFVNAICTPNCYLLDLGRKQYRFDGYKELSYLAPKYFTPNPLVLEKLNLKKGEPFFILRFVSLTATHDTQEFGINDKAKIVKILEKYGRVFISSEIPLIGNLAKYRINIPVYEMHSVMYYASLVMGESATMASEAACLGTPAIFVSESTRGYIEELSNKYGLIFRYYGKTAEIDALSKAQELLKDKALKTIWQEKTKNMLKEKTDVVNWMVTFIENFIK